MHPGEEWQYVLMVVVLHRYTKRCCVDLYGQDICFVGVLPMLASVGGVFVSKMWWGDANNQLSHIKII